jgi:predicted nucleic acid-binding protein
MRLVLDTYALMAYLRREPGHADVRRLLQETLEGRHQTSMSVINLGELFYMQYRKSTPAQAYRAMQFVRRAGIRVETATNERVMNAARLKATVAISYADAFAASLAQELDAVLVTGDPEYKPLADSLRIHWLHSG